MSVERFFSLVRMKLHWGYAVSVPGASKQKPSLLLPPPTTLVGALSYGKFRGRDSEFLSGQNASPAIFLGDVRAAARFADGCAGMYAEDVVKNMISYFQEARKDKETGQMRTTSMKYRSNIIPSGRVYAPGSELLALYVTSDLDPDELKKLSWSIIRLGSKEGLVSVEEVRTGVAKPVQGRVRTPYYFPAMVRHGGFEGADFMLLDFWEGGYAWGKEAAKKTYVVPMPRFPIACNEVWAEAKEAYECDGETVVFS
jgi:CRISPR-associated protein Cas5a/b/c